MRSIKQLVKELIGDRPREYDAFSILDSNVLTLEERIKKLEALNIYYYCTAYRATDQSIPNAANTDINFTSTVYPQLGNMHDDTVDNEKMYVRRDGVYVITGGVKWETDAVGRRILSLDHYGPAGFKDFINITIRQGQTTDDRQAIAGIRYLSVDDYITLRVRQESGGPLNIEGNVNNPHPNLSMIEIRQDLDPSEYGLLNPTELTS